MKVKYFINGTLATEEQAKEVCLDTLFDWSGYCMEMEV